MVWENFGQGMVVSVPVMQVGGMMKGLGVVVLAEESDIPMVLPTSLMCCE